MLLLNVIDNIPESAQWRASRALWYNYCSLLDFDFGLILQSNDIDNERSARAQYDTVKRYILITFPEIAL